MGTLRGFPTPPALRLRRAKPALAYAIMGTLEGFASPFGPPRPPLPRSLRSASPNPPAMVRRRQGRRAPHATDMGTLKGFASPFGPPRD